MRGTARRSWATKGIGAAGIAGLALVAAAVMLVLSSLGSPGHGVPGVTGVSAQTSTPEPTATNTPAATVSANCVLKVTKEADVSTVPVGGQITYTITITNKGTSTSGYCGGLAVTDKVPDDTDCVSAGVDSSSDITNSHFDIPNDCPRSSGTVKWEVSGSSSSYHLNHGDSAVLTMVVDVTAGTADGTTIDNEACATAENDQTGDCDSASTTVTSGTPAPTAGPTAITPPIAPAPTSPPIAPPPPLPTAAKVPLVIPNTGSGPGSSGNSALAIALGLAGGALVLLSGTGVWLRRRS